MSDFKPTDELKNHPSVRNMGPDTPIDYDEEMWLRLVSENVAEANSISVDQAKQNIRMGCDDQADYATPRDYIAPLSNTVASHDEA